MRPRARYTENHTAMQLAHFIHGLTALGVFVIGTNEDKHPEWLASKGHGMPDDTVWDIRKVDEDYMVMANGDPFMPCRVLGDVVGPRFVAPGETVADAVQRLAADARDYEDLGTRRKDLVAEMTGMTVEAIQRAAIDLLDRAANDVDRANAARAGSKAAIAAYREACQKINCSRLMIEASAGHPPDRVLYP